MHWANKNKRPTAKKIPQLNSTKFAKYWPIYQYIGLGRPLLNRPKVKLSFTGNLHFHLALYARLQLNFWEFLKESAMLLCLHFNGITMHHQSTFGCLFDWLIHCWEMYLQTALQSQQSKWLLKWGVISVGTGTRLSVLCCYGCCQKIRSAEKHGVCGKG